MGNKVLAASLKAAVNTAAIKQVAAAGLHVSRSACVFSGSKAFAVWSSESVGCSYKRNCRQFRISYPAIPDEALLTRVEADLIAAYTLHETGHVIYTPNDANVIRYTYGKRYHALANGFEDGRMEDAVIRGGIAKNARSLFQRLLNKLTCDVPRQWNPCDIANAPFAIALLARQARGNGNKFTLDLLDRIPAPYQAIYNGAYEACTTAPMGFDTSYWSYQMAVKFMDAWNKMREEQGKKPEKGESPPVNPKPDDDESEDNYNEEGEDDDFSDEFDEADDSPESSPESNPEPGSPPPKEDDEPDQSDEPGDEPGQPGESAKGDEPDKDDKGDEAGGEPDESGEPDEDDESDQSDAGGSGYSDTGDSGQPKSPEPNIDDLFKRINKRSDGSKKSGLGAFAPAERGYDVMDYLMKELGIR